MEEIFAACVDPPAKYQGDLSFISRFQRRLLIFLDALKLCLFICVSTGPFARIESAGHFCSILAENYSFLGRFGLLKSLFIFSHSVVIDHRSAAACVLYQARAALSATRVRSRVICGQASSFSLCSESSRVSYSRAS